MWLDMNVSAPKKFLRHKGMRQKGVHQKVDLGAAGESLRHKAMRSEILRHKGVALNNALSVTSWLNFVVEVTSSYCRRSATLAPMGCWLAIECDGRAC